MTYNVLSGTLSLYTTTTAEIDVHPQYASFCWKSSDTVGKIKPD